MYGGLRIGLYDPVKAALGGGDGFGVKVGAGLATGALAICVASPTDLVKVRMQAEGKLPPGAPRRYPSAFGAYRTIVRTDGVRGLWAGLGPNIGRNAIINAAELASYDQVKQGILNSGLLADGAAVHLLAGLGAGFFAVCCGSPVDVVKSRMMGEGVCRGWVGRTGGERGAAAGRRSAPVLLPRPLSLSPAPSLSHPLLTARTGGGAKNPARGGRAHPRPPARPRRAHSSAPD